MLGAVLIFSRKFTESPSSRPSRRVLVFGEHQMETTLLVTAAWISVGCLFTCAGCLSGIVRSVGETHQLLFEINSTLKQIRDK